MARRSTSKLRLHSPKFAASAKAWSEFSAERIAASVAVVDIAAPHVVQPKDQCSSRTRGVGRAVLPRVGAPVSEQIRVAR